MPLFYRKPMKPPTFKDVPIIPEPYWLRPDYLPHLEQAQSFHNLTWLNPKVLPMQRPTLAFDVEVYPNYFMVGFRDVNSGEAYFVETLDQLNNQEIQQLVGIFVNCVGVGFNSIKYDVPMLSLALGGCTTEQIFTASSKLINDDIPWKEIRRELPHREPPFLPQQHIDLREVAPLHGSLKVYSGRLHCPRIQDLPFPPDTPLTREQIQCVRYYNLASDLPATSWLYHALKPQLEIRKKMMQRVGIDLQSKSDAQIAEAYIRAELQRRNVEPRVPAIPPGTGFRYKPPAWMAFQTETMNNVFQTVLNANFIVAESGSVTMPQELSDLKVEIGSGVYRMGIGGLHSSETSVVNRTDDEGFLVDKDVTSYYPSIIINNELYPEHLGPVFLEIFRELRDNRVHAKATKDGDTAQTLKIVINGTFGKLGSKYSIFYSPNLLIQVTVTGQLSLLMLIERLELDGIKVVSANTDGVVIKCPHDKGDLLETRINQWEAITGFEMESTLYDAVYSRDVNNYIAVKPDGKVKLKGAYANPWGDEKNPAGWLQKNPTGTICIEAVVDYLRDKKSLESTIRGCQRLDKFLFVRTVKGGGVKVGDRLPPPHSSKEELVLKAGWIPHCGMWRRDYDKLGLETVTLDYAYAVAKHNISAILQSEYIGKTVRWYYAKDTDGCIVYAENGNKVPKSDGAKPCLDLPDVFPSDVDYNWYINEAKSILKDIGVEYES